MNSVKIRQHVFFYSVLVVFIFFFGGFVYSDYTADKSQSSDCKLDKSTISFLNSKKTKSITDYYEVLRSCRTFDKDYKLKKEKGQWVTRSTADEPIPVLVDIKNGLIEIKDEGSGGALTTTQLALFRSKSGEAIIAVNVMVREGVSFGFSSSRPAFYIFDKQKGTMVDITAKVFPIITSEDFNIKKSDFSRLHNVEYLKTYFKVLPLAYYSLPHHGTNITVHLIINKDELEQHMYYYRKKMKNEEIGIIDNYKALINKRNHYG